MNRKLAIMTALGFECAILVTALVLIGRYLDSHYGWGGLGAGLGAFIGVIGWVSHLLIFLRGLAKNSESSDTEF